MLDASRGPIESALVPVMNDRLAAADTSEAKEAALLGLRMVDPASGSGHFRSQELLCADAKSGREWVHQSRDGVFPRECERGTAIQPLSTLHYVRTGRPGRL